MIRGPRLGSPPVCKGQSGWGRPVDSAASTPTSVDSCPLLVLRPVAVWMRVEKHGERLGGGRRDCVGRGSCRCRGRLRRAACAAGLEETEFDWGTGETPRRSARISEKLKAVPPPETEPKKKRSRRSPGVKKGTEGTEVASEEIPEKIVHRMDSYVAGRGSTLKEEAEGAGVNEKASPPKEILGNAEVVNVEVHAELEGSQGTEDARSWGVEGPILDITEAEGAALKEPQDRVEGNAVGEAAVSQALQTGENGLDQGNNVGPNVATSDKGVVLVKQNALPCQADRASPPVEVEAKRKSETMENGGLDIVNTAATVGADILGSVN